MGYKLGGGRFNQKAKFQFFLCLPKILSSILATYVAINKFMLSRNFTILIFSCDEQLKKWRCHFVCLLEVLFLVWSIKTFCNYKLICYIVKGQFCHFATLQLCNNETLQLCNFVSLQLCNFATFQRCNFATLHLCIFATLQLCNFATLQFCNFATLKLCNIATLQHCNFATLQSECPVIPPGH